jgi:hypothetical protein
LSYDPNLANEYALSPLCCSGQVKLATVLYSHQNFRYLTSQLAQSLILLQAQKADVVAIHEVVGRHIFEHVTVKMPEYHFHITEGPQTQEILVG